MRDRGGRDFMVGSMSVLALLILAVGIMSVGGESALWTGTVRYRVVFDDTSGLRPGSPVKVAGVQIGSVERIVLPMQPGLGGIEVWLSLREEYAERIRSDSKAVLRYLQWLSGEKYVEVTAGDPAKPELPPDSTLQVLQEAELFEQGEDIARNLNEITVALREILDPIRRGEGLLGEMIQDPEFGKEGVARLRGALENLDAITQQVRSGRGFAGRAIYDPAFAGSIDRLSSALEHFGSFMEALDRREGAVGALLNEDGAGEEMIGAMRDAAVSLREVADRLRSRYGLIGRLLNDTSYSEQLAVDLRETIRNGAEITRKINEGEGTLGALVNDRVLYDSAEEVVAGVGDSKFARWMLRHYQKKGIKLEGEAEEQYPDATEGP